MLAAAVCVLPDRLVLTPATTNKTVVCTCMLAHTGTGIDAVIAKRLDQPYRPRLRGWQKLRTRITAEAVQQPASVVLRRQLIAAQLLQEVPIVSRTPFRTAPVSA
jgi:hypothetical protein